MTFVQLHGYALGFVIIGSWLIIMFWALVLRLLRAEETPVFWRVVSVAQILLGLQFFAGMALLTMWTLGGAGLPGDGSAFDVTFHFLYGAGFPVLALGVAHWWARTGRYNPYTIFATVGLVNFGLTFRALQVGLGG